VFSKVWFDWFLTITSSCDYFNSGAKLSYVFSSFNFYNFFGFLDLNFSCPAPPLLLFFSLESLLTGLMHLMVLGLNWGIFDLSAFTLKHNRILPIVSSLKSYLVSFSRRLAYFLKLKILEFWLILMHLQLLVLLLIHGIRVIWKCCNRWSFALHKPIGGLSTKLLPLLVPAPLINLCFTESSWWWQLVKRLLGPYFRIIKYLLKYI